LRNIHRLEAVLNRTGLNLKDIAPLPKSMIMGMGGPFIPYHPDMKHSDGKMLLESELELRLNRFEKLRDAVSVLPLVAPVRKGYVSSHYGRRKDPFNGRWAMHRGIDFVAPYKSKVEATAPGIVSYVGRRGRYGRTVDIRHQHGLMTRFAHLYRYRVKVGQKVKMGDTIALLGNSGRSTGPHVHYEIRHNGKFMNPRRFLRATRNVQ
jgi:murein DD-endopeptidase MepM/ murein hydrolase activator NlpD